MAFQQEEKYPHCGNAGRINLLPDEAARVRSNAENPSSGVQIDLPPKDLKFCEKWLKKEKK